MERIPEATDELSNFIVSDVLYGIELESDTTEQLLSYMNERHEHLFGTHTTYFVLGSYEPPFRYRLDKVLDELNNRHDAYAFLLATQEDPDLPDDIPDLKVKFYLHASYADWIPLIVEHDTGGAIVEFGRIERPELLERTYALPRCYKEMYDESSLRRSLTGVQARAVELAYYADDLDAELESLVQEANSNDIDVTKQDLEKHLDDQLDRRRPSYSGVLTDSLKHLVRFDQCTSWTTIEELRGGVGDIP
jgi:hypothetical protein